MARIAPAPGASGDQHRRIQLQQNRGNAMQWVRPQAALVDSNNVTRTQWGYLASGLVGGLVNNSSGGTVAYFGQLPDGTDGIAINNTFGVVIVELNNTGLSQYNNSSVLVSQLSATGLEFFNASAQLLLALGDTGGIVYDTSGNPRAYFGKLFSSTDYGFGVEDTLGNKWEILPPVEDFTSASYTDTTAGLSTDGASPTVTAVIGAQGLYKAEVSCQIITSNAGDTGQVALYMDGTIVDTVLNYTVSGETFNITFGNIRRFAAAAGSHTFALYYLGSASGVTYQNRGLIITPQ